MLERYMTPSSFAEGPVGVGAGALIQVAFQFDGSSSPISNHACSAVSQVSSLGSSHWSYMRMRQ